MESKQPKTLLEVVNHFSDEQTAFEYMRDRRWPNGVVCPRCNSDKVHAIESRKIWRCNGCKRQFSVKVGTIFEDSPISFTKWLPAMWLIANAKNGISSYEVHRALGVTQKTAWFMLHRIRLALQEGTFEKLGGPEGPVVEVDETFIGGKVSNMHQSKKRPKNYKNNYGKETVFGMIERNGRARTFHVASARRRELLPRMMANIMPNSQVFTDSHTAYFGLQEWYKHEFVDHTVEYVVGQVHTNTLENYWSLLKRTIRGTYVSVEPYHLWRYLDEQAFRFNERKRTDGERFRIAVSRVSGRRLTYNELTNKTSPAPQGGAY